jgi:glycosyltransferase involved in cell wall biosynthesis
MFGYAYVGYPIVLAALPRRRPSAPVFAPDEWPILTITVPVYNEERNLADALDALLNQDYPPDRRQIIVISDASTDGRDDIARRYASQGVELLLLAQRRG